MKPASYTQGAMLVFVGLVCASVYLLSFFKPLKWEYLLLSPPDFRLQDELRKAGEDGWELVSTRRAVMEDTAELDKPEARYEMILRRAKRF